VRALVASTTRVIDGGGRTVIPGLIDSHVHALGVAAAEATQPFQNLRSIGEQLNVRVVLEGSVRRSDKAYLVYLETSLGSACEVRYLLRLAVRLGFLKTEEISSLEARYSDAIRTLQKLIDTIARSIKSQKRQTRAGESRKPKAES